MDVIFIIGIFLSFFQSFLLFKKKYKSLPDKLLAVWMGIIGIHLLNYYLYLLGYWTLYPHLIGVTVPVPLLHGPMLYLYVLYSLRDKQSLRKKDYLHFTPAMLGYLYMFRFYFFYSAEEKVMVDKGLVDDFSLFSNILLILFVISGFAYPLLSYKKLAKYKRLIDTNFSYDEGISLNWLKYSIWGIVGVFLAAAVVIFTREVMHLDFGFNADLIFYSLIVIFVFRIGYYGIRHQNIFTNNMIRDEMQLIHIRPEREYKKSGLKQDRAQAIHRELLLVMTEKKPYLNPKLTLVELAQLLNISSNHLSQIINQYELVNFHDFVNRYRVEEFIHRAASNSRYNILTHALDSGFNSKSSFNSVFKKHKEMTPSQFMTTIKN